MRLPAHCFGKEPEEGQRFAVPVFTYWLTEPVRSTGDIRMPLPTDRREGGHAMCFVGYQDDASVPGGGFFLAGAVHLCRQYGGRAYVYDPLAPTGY